MGKRYRRFNKPRDIEDALMNKGFKKRSDLIDGHTAYVIFENPVDQSGKKIYTFMSRGGHGNKTLSEDLLHAMSKQLHFRNYADFQKYMECNISEEEYRDEMRSKGPLNLRPRKRRTVRRSL